MSILHSFFLILKITRHCPTVAKATLTDVERLRCVKRELEEFKKYFLESFPTLFSKNAILYLCSNESCLFGELVDKTVLLKR